METAKLASTIAGALLLALAPSGLAAAYQAPRDVYRVDWNQAPFAEPMWLVQCSGPCPNDGLALVADPGAFPAGSLRVLGGPYRHGTDLEQDRDRLVAAGLPATPLRVDVRDNDGQRIDGLVLAAPAELQQLLATATRRNAGQTAPQLAEAPPPPAGASATPSSQSSAPSDPSELPVWIIQIELEPIEDYELPSAGAAGGLSSQDLESLNRRGSYLESHLRRTDELIAAIDRDLRLIETGRLVDGHNGELYTPEQVVDRRRSVWIAESGNPFAELDGSIVEQGLAEHQARTRERAGRLRDMRQEMLARRDQIRRELGQIRRIVMADADRPGNAYRPGSADGGGCGLPHGWRVAYSGGSAASTWRVDAAGTARSTDAVSGARELGLDSATGTAALNGNRLTIRFTIPVSGNAVIAGRYLATLDDDCSGAGSMIVDSAPPGLAWQGQSQPVTFTSLSGR